MLFLLAGSSSFSFAETPNYIPCDYTFTIHFYTNPSNGGTIDGYSNGQSVTYRYDPIPCSENRMTFSMQASPNSGFEFSSWSTGTTSNPTSLTVSADSSASITDNFVPLPDILGLLSYSCSPPCGGSSGNSPPSTVTNSGPVSGFSQSKYCGVAAADDPYCIWITTDSYNGNNYAHLVLIDNTSAITDGNPYYYPNGNTTVNLTLQLVSTTSVYVTGMGVDFITAKGNPINIGDAFELTYSDTLGAELVNLQHNIWQEGSFVLGINQILGENYRTLSYALGDLSYVLAVTPGTQNYDNLNIPHLYAPVTSWLTSQQLSCILGFAALGAGTTAAASIFFTWGLDSELAEPVIVASFGAGSLYFGGCFS